MPVCGSSPTAREMACRAAQIAQRTEVNVEILVGGEQRSQTRDGVRGRKLKRGMVRGMPVVLLEAPKEKRFVFADRPANCESKNIVGENRTWKPR